MLDWKALALAAAFLLGGPPVAENRPETQSADHELAGAAQALDHFLALSRAEALTGPEGLALVTGEAARKPIPTLGPVGKPDALVSIGPGRAVARLPFDQALPPELYIYLTRSDGVWRIECFRILWIPQLVQKVREDLRAKPERTPKESAQLRGFDLLFESDGRLREWFGLHRADLDNLVALTRTEKPLHSGDGGKRWETAPIQERLDVLGLDMITGAADGSIDLSIGGILDNSAGFVFIPAGARPPAIDPHDHIWVEPMAGGWYLYKTT